MRRFYCENCAAEVSATSDVCPVCGAFFVAIKCPACGYRGKSYEFRHGCPKCGYLGEESVAEVSERSRTEPDSATHNTSGAAGGRGAAHRAWYQRTRGDTPWWVFWLALGALALAFLVLARVYITL